ncbi:lysylphosphatidylglycerol synthase transmembrane domain-containing protein [uncultured Arcobacter sp.]|uniref:lysylphosphatidylglycerol synthase transmembrane domain-containing protein n=1 Tax=uncultured Arcobacter sp. TaxID=165434 RepID=UPI00262BAF9B|nr:lysylphosphatidylglycerol synthase transmembrane domain-containing protein [uncultured Arcobacter sp.]
MNKLINLLVVILALIYLVYNTNINELVASLSSYSFYAISYVVVITILSFLFFAIRWQTLTSSSISFYNSYKTNLISMAINQILPARAGDFYKPVYIKKNYGVNLHNSISSLILERSLDLMILFILGLIVLLGTTFFDNFYFLIPITIFLFIALFIFVKYAKEIIYITKRISNKKVRVTILKIIINLYKTKSYILFNSIYATIVLYIFYIVSLYGFIYLFTEFNLTIFEIMIVFVISALGMSLPSSPAGIGVYEATIVYILGYFNINSSEALSFAIVYHVVQIITIMCLWLFFVLEKKYV